MAPGLGWCAWYGDAIRVLYVDDHGVRYHVACYERRRGVISADIS